MLIAFRSVRPGDWEYCLGLFLSGMMWIIRERGQDPDEEARRLREQWKPARTWIITVDGADVGWVESSDINRESYSDALFVDQLHIDGPYRRRGIGTEVMKRIIAGAARTGRAVAVGVAKPNRPSLRLVKKLGFRVTREEKHMLYLRLETLPITGSDAGVAKTVETED